MKLLDLKKKNNKNDYKTVQRSCVTNRQKKSQTYSEIQRKG